MNRWVLSAQEFYSSVISYVTELGLPWHEHDSGDWREAVDGYQDYLRQIMGETREGSVLNPSCGWGRQALALAELGWQVTAIDLAEAYLELAQKRAAERGVSLDLRTGDMRSLDPAFSGRFDWVVSGYALYDIDEEEGIRAAVRGMYRALKPGGACLIQLRDMDTLMREQPRHDFHGEWSLPEGRVICVEDWEYESDTHVIHMYAFLREDRRYDDYRRWTTKTLGYRKWALRRGELERFLREAGFATVEFGPYIPWTSYEVVARKAGNS